MTDLFASQMDQWPQARQGHDALRQVLTRTIEASCSPSASSASTDDCPFVLQFNPARIRSTAAKVDARSLAQRPCFLCAEHRPAEQRSQFLQFVDEQTGEARTYDLLVNPYPILEEHYTLASCTHQPQMLTSAIVGDMQRLLALLGDEFIVFYNGPHCGASAPDHLHLQAGRWQGVPLVEWVLRQRWGRGVHRLSPLGAAVELHVGAAPVPTTDDVNVVALRQEDVPMYIVIPRRHHRPPCYAAEGSAQRLVSPGALDMCGLVVCPRREDFEALTRDELVAILRECGEWLEPVISVGILKAREVRYEQHADSFTLHGVTIGKEFHWQQQEEQRFEGRLRLLADGDEWWAIDDIGVEDYLKSVVSSEMNAAAPLEFLKAHAIVSRSWLLAQLERRRSGKNETKATAAAAAVSDSADEVIRWYDHDDHTLFDVCADDHCQRYQGLARITDAARRAVAETRGMVLTYGGRVVDARFSKCCGGVSERYETCWDDTPHPELASVSDCDETGQCFCSTPSDELLRTVLNSYDTATRDYYRWQVRYTPDELGALIARRSGIDVGTVEALEPVERGVSGRLSRLRIVGSKHTVVVGKELEIRRWLSPTHLYSSAFQVERTGTHFVLHGSGWGHGVGLCQIGAAVMGSRGYTCQQILEHYYPTCRVERIYGVHE